MKFWWRCSGQHTTHVLKQFTHAFDCHARVNLSSVCEHINAGAKWASTDCSSSGFPSACTTLNNSHSIFDVHPVCICHPYNYSVQLHHSPLKYHSVRLGGFPCISKCHFELYSTPKLGPILLKVLKPSI